MCVDCNQEKADNLQCPRCNAPNSFIKLKMDSFIPQDKEKVDGYYCEECHYFKYNDKYMEKILKLIKENENKENENEAK